MLWNVLLCATLAALSASVSAQTAGVSTVTDFDNGGATEVLSISDDGFGDLFTSVISTFTDPGLAASTTSTTPSTTLTPPTATGTALPPFSSFVVSSGTIINYSEFTKTAEPSTSTTSSGAAAPTLGAPPMVVPAAMLGGIGIALAML